MNSAEALRRLRRLGVPVITTVDAAIALDLRIDAASQTLRRLARAGLAWSVRKGLWAIDRLPEPLSLVPLIARPYSAYVSLHSALHLHEMIEQIPQQVAVVSVGRSCAVCTPCGTYRIHHLPEALYGGFDDPSPRGFSLARPEKAIFDLFYLGSVSRHRSVSLPETRVPRSFRIGALRGWLEQIASPRLRTLTARAIERFWEQARP
jgi:predicted transcriptional regulator of viral defense system